MGLISWLLIGSENVYHLSLTQLWIPPAPNSSCSAYHLLPGSLMVKLQVNDDCTSQSFLDGLIKPTPQYKAIAAIGPFFFFFPSTSDNVHCESS